MKICMMIGEPCVGKSTIVRRFLGPGAYSFHTPKYVPHHYSSELHTAVLGRYDEPRVKFPGTDRMSMAAQPHVLTWIGKQIAAGPTRILFEGDRLGTDSMVASLASMEGVDLTILRVYVPQAELDRRRAAERVDQNPKFVAGRATKIANMLGSNSAAQRFSVKVQEIRNSEPGDVDAAVRSIRRILGLPV